MRVLLGVEAASFFLAAMIHAGVLISGYEHHEAMIAESVIGTVLLGGLVITFAPFTFNVHNRHNRPSIRITGNARRNFHDHHRHWPTYCPRYCIPRKHRGGVSSWSWIGPTGS